MCTIVLKDIMNSTILLPDAGNLFYLQIVNGVESSDKVIIDMTDVTALPSVFLNVSIGRLIDEWGMDKLKKSMAFTKITKQQALRLRDYMNKYGSSDRQCKEDKSFSVAVPN